MTNETWRVVTPSSIIGCHTPNNCASCLFTSAFFLGVSSTDQRVRSLKIIKGINLESWSVRPHGVVSYITPQVLRSSLVQRRVIFDWMKNESVDAPDQDGNGFRRNWLGWNILKICADVFHSHISFLKSHEQSFQPLKKRVNGSPSNIFQRTSPHIWCPRDGDPQNLALKELISSVSLFQLYVFAVRRKYLDT